MDFKQIEAFISVAKYKSFSKAAYSIFLSQPAISSHILSLEKELSIQLFDRTSKEVLLTPAGESFLNYAIDILNCRDKAIHHLSSFNNNVSGTLKLASSTTPCNTLVPILIKDFSKSFPDVSFNITELGSGQIIENIIKFDYEIGIVGKIINDEKIKSYTLEEDELVLISSPLLNLPTEVSINSILKNKFILREKSSATRKTFEDAMIANNLDPSVIDICCEVNSLDTIFQFVKTGIGVSIVSKNVCSDYISSGYVNKSRITNLSLKRNIYLVVSSKRTLTPTAKAFFNFCKDYFNFEE